MKNSILYYSVGPLLYCPANNESIVNSIVEQKFGDFFSLALCLEDTINDICVEDAENKLVNTIKTLYNTLLTRDFYMPKIFIRVRDSKQITDLMTRFSTASSIITGFIIPKFSQDNADEYIYVISKINTNTSHTIYMMPIFENPSIINLKERYNILYELKEKLDSIEQFVLNIRVGGNDLCHMFGFRRCSNESIYHIKPIASILSDIVTVFGMDYVVSGPVWEYYNGSNWSEGLTNEVNEDRLCGFVGKTVIHPNQIPIIKEIYKVSEDDLSDAKAILNWDTNTNSLVSGNTNSERMNEYKTHYNWAKKILFLSEVYGVKNK